MLYNYIYFTGNYDGIILRDGEYNIVSLSDITEADGVQIVRRYMDWLPLFLRKLERRHRWHGGRFFVFPLSLWYPFYFKCRVSDDRPFCFIIGSRDIPAGYISYLRRRYPGCKVVRLLRDLVKVDSLLTAYNEETIRETFDLVMSYDPDEAARCGFINFIGPASRVEVPVSEDCPLCDVYFCGSAKNRMERIVSAYDKLTDAGLKCRFTVFCRDPEVRVAREGIEYVSSYIPYRDVLHWSVNSVCILDINQDGAVGYTPRYYEAVMYDKLLITDNPLVRDSPYFNDNFMFIIDGTGSVDPAFVNRGKRVRYGYRGDFSPRCLLEQIEGLLVERYGGH